MKINKNLVIDLGTSGRKEWEEIGIKNGYIDGNNAKKP